MPIGLNNTKHFLSPIRSQHLLDPGALPPVLEDFRRAFSPGLTDWPLSLQGCGTLYQQTIFVL